MMQIPVILPFIMLGVIVFLVVLLLNSTYKFKEFKESTTYYKGLYNQSLEKLSIKGAKIQEYELAFLTLKGLFYSRPKSLSNGIIKKSFEIKENGEVHNTVKVTQPNKTVKRVKQKGLLYFEYLDYKDLITFENIKLACTSKTPQEFNKYYEELARSLENIKKTPELPS